MLQTSLLGDEQWRSLILQLNQPSVFVYFRWSWSWSRIWSCLHHVAGVPVKPSGVLVNGSTPNTLGLQVLPPGERNGLDVLGYQVRYEGGVYDFDAGKAPFIATQPNSTQLDVASADA